MHSTTSFLIVALSSLSLTSAYANPFEAFAPRQEKMACPGAIPSLPSTDGSTQLPTPSAPLKYVTIGRGIQNYTCASPSATPVAIGAVADLFDISFLASSNPAAAASLPPIFLGQDYEACLSGLPPAMPVTVGTFVPQYIGHHFFGADGTPIFDLTVTKEIILSKKEASVNAPASADKGALGTGAVAWLDLSAKPGSVGLKQVYRVITAGGNPKTTCADTKAGEVMSIPYSAQYWFFG